MISRRRGVIELVAAALIFGLMAYLAKQTTRAVDGAQSAFVRFAVGVLVCAAHFASRRAWPRFVRKDLPRLRVIAMIVAGAGVTLVVVGQGRALGGAYGWQLVGLLSALCSGVAVTAIRAARRTDGAWEVFTAVGLLGMLCTGPFAFAGWRAPSTGMWILLVAVGLVAATAQLLMTHALGAVDAASAGIIGQLTVVTALALGHTFDGEPFTALSMLGALLTIAGVATATAVGGAMRLSSAPRRG